MKQSGFSLIELLVAATIFTFIVSASTGLFMQALDLQRRATSIQKIEENAQFFSEAIAREVRVSVVTSSDTSCTPPDPLATNTLVIQHPVNGTVTYRYDTSTGVGMITRNGQPMTSNDVNFKSFAFCIQGSSTDGEQSRVTMPMTIESVTGRPSTRVSVSLQTTVVSRDVATDLNR